MALSRLRHGIAARPNKHMTLTRLVGAPVRQAEVLLRAFRGFAAARNPFAVHLLSF